MQQHKLHMTMKPWVENGKDTILTLKKIFDKPQSFDIMEVCQKLSTTFILKKGVSKFL